MAHKPPPCFGDLEQVFPMTSDGLRHSPAPCLACDVKTNCLKAAIAGKNQTIVAGEKVDRGYQAGNISFLQRWSRRKLLYHENQKTRVPQPE